MGLKDIKATIQRCPDDDNRHYLSVSSERKCPYCDEKITATQVTFRIIKTKPNRKDCVKGFSIIKRLEDSCGWNCSRRVIDKLNAERTEEEIKKGIEYRRG